MGKLSEAMDLFRLSLDLADDAIIENDVEEWIDKLKFKMSELEG
jgi:hypothetical protein